jgi:hypothetical protein
MASELFVETLKGLTSGANANKVIIPSGQTLEAPGVILQILEFSPSADAATSSTSFVDSNHTLSITPTSTSSKILITFEAPIRLSGTDRVRGGVRIQRDGSSLFTGYQEERQLHSSSAGSSTEFTNPTIKTYLDSPNTTSSVTYTVQHIAATSSVTSRIYGTAAGGVSVLRLMEIAG